MKNLVKFFVGAPSSVSAMYLLADTKNLYMNHNTGARSQLNWSWRSHKRS